MADDDVATCGTEFVNESGGESGDHLCRELGSDEASDVVGFDEGGKVDRGIAHAPKTT